MRPIWDDLRRKVDAVAPSLPEGIDGPIVNDELGDVFGIQLAIIGEGYSYAELKEVADEVRDELLHVRDVAKVEIVGAQPERIFVEYNNARLAEMGLEELQGFSEIITQDVFDVLTLEGSVAARDHIGGTAPDQVLAAIKRVRETFK